MCWCKLKSVRILGEESIEQHDCIREQGSFGEMMRLNAHVLGATVRTSPTQAGLEVLLVFKRPR